MKLIGLLRAEKKYFLVVLISSMLLFIAMMVQSYIRYGAHATYNPWISVQYLLVVYLLFLVFLPWFFMLAQRLKLQAGERYFWQVGILTVGWLVGYYVLSSMTFRALGFFEGEAWISSTYASYYFGRDALFHFFILGGTAFFLKWRNGAPKKISGTIGRRRVEVQSSNVCWIEADDHYLKVHTPQYELLTRSTLDRMARELDPDFVRIHRKYLVNRKMIIGTERVQRDQFVILDSGEKIKVGRSYAASIQN